MKQAFSDVMVSYFLKGGVLLETKGDFETEIDIPIGTENDPRKVSVRIKCKDLTIRTIKEENGGA